MDPDIKIFHDFLSDFEINYLERLSQNKVNILNRFIQKRNYQMLAKFSFQQDEIFILERRTVQCVTKFLKSHNFLVLPPFVAFDLFPYFAIQDYFALSLFLILFIRF